MPKNNPACPPALVVSDSGIYSDGDPAINPELIQPAPPVVGQGHADDQCWCAALESWLRALVAKNGPRRGNFSDNTNRWFGVREDRHKLDGYAWLRKSATVQEILDNYTPLNIVTQDGGLVNGEALEQVAADNGMNWEYVDITTFYKDMLRPKFSNGHLYIAYYSLHMYHASIVYGFSAKGVLVMNPHEGGEFYDMTYDFLRAKKRFAQKIFVGWPESGSPLTVDHIVEKYLIGEWHVLIGSGASGWSGYFVFGTGNDVYWRTFDQTAKHRGTWKREGMTVTWHFSDDDPNFLRTFVIPINGDNTIPDRIQGTATTKRSPVSFFTMTRADD
jgi:hypothetical protein